MNVKRELIYVSRFASTQMGPMTVSATVDTHLTVMDYHAVVSNKSYHDCACMITGISYVGELECGEYYL